MTKSDPRAPRDARPVLAAGLCVAAALIAWPLVRDRGGRGGPPDPARSVPVPGDPATSVAGRGTAPSRPALPIEAPGSGSVARVPAGRPQARAGAAARAAEVEGAPEEKTGIQAFPPPGTSPPLAGIMVPDDYELPPGYVRHYQTTDDGKRLPPILMFHPDFQPVDDRGRPIPIPPDRVVPPELAPPGLPHDVLVVPETHVPMFEDPPQ